MNPPAPVVHLPELATLRAWLQSELADEVALFGPRDRPLALGVWYPTHLQVARLETRHPVPLVVIQTTFCAVPRRRRTVLALLAHANQQLERGRWFLQRDPTRLTYAMDLPATRLDAPRLAREWRRFYNEAVAHGIELTLRSRATSYVDLLRQRRRAQPASPH
jgi:hypothetical protein